MKFIKDSIRELKHVVWPTKEDTWKYFITVVTVLVLFGIYLFVFANIFSEGLLGIKRLVNPTETTVIKSGDVTISTGKVSTGTVETNTGSTWTTSTWVAN